MQFHGYEIGDDCHLRSVEADSISPRWLTDDIHRWIDLTEFKHDELETLLAPLSLNSEVLEACLVPQSRPLVIALEDALFISIPVQTVKDGMCYFTLLCCPTTLITIQHVAIQYMDDLAAYYLKDRRLVVANTAGLVFELINRSLRKSSPVFFSLRDDVVAVGKKLEEDRSAIEVDDIMKLGRVAAENEILLQDQHYCVTELLGGHSESLALKTIRTDLIDFVSDLERAQSAINRLQDRVRDLHQYQLHDVEEATNRRLNMLTLLSAIYLPPTLLTSIFGMGFDNIPIIGMRYGYAIVVVMMIVIVVAQLFFFRWRGWFK